MNYKEECIKDFKDIVFKLNTFISKYRKHVKICSYVQYEQIRIKHFV